MNKMAKGAIATAAGVVLLVGGGGTLAVWNVEKEANAGTIASGNMTLTAGDGHWRINKGAPIEADQIVDHKIVPGDVLTYSQPITAVLTGEYLEATLNVTGIGANGVDHEGFVDRTFKVEQVALTEVAGAVEDSILKQGTTTATATATFTFHSDDALTSGTASMNAKYDFNTVGFALEQVNPAQ